jgi:hypothetical protein
MNYQVDFTIDPGLNTIDTHVYTIRDIPSRFAEFASVNGIEPDSISTASPNQASLITVFQNIDYDFLETLSVWILSAEDPTDTQEMFYLDFVDFNEDEEVRLLSSIANVVDYLREGQFDIEIRLRLRNFSPAEINSRLLFNITAFD